MKKYYPFNNPPLPYSYDALEPYIDRKTMELHHDKHLQSYVDNLNRVLENSRFQNLSLEQLIYNADRLPDDISVPIRNYAGGVYNHWFYFEGMCNCKLKQPTGILLQSINDEFGSLEKFKDVFSKAAMSVFGSGYAWLVKDNGKLKIITTPNQNNPIEDGLCPVLNIDVWEHAYYLKNYNVRKDYIDNWFNVVNWETAQRNYNECK